MTFGGDGLRTVSVLVRSRYGAETVFSDSVIVDTQGPSVTVSGVPAETVADTVTVTLDAVDGLTAVSALTYDLDGQGEAPYEGPVSASSDGTHTLTYRATDALGNQTAARQRPPRPHTHTPPHPHTHTHAHTRLRSRTHTHTHAHLADADAH